MEFLVDLKSTFSSNSNAEFALQMKQYLVNKFELYGIKATKRRQLLKPIILKHKDYIKNNIDVLCTVLYNEAYRESHLCAIEIYEKEKRRTYQKSDIEFIKFLITTNSHWDTVDFVAKQILGKYLLTFPEEIQSVIESLSKSENMWLNRSAILFQLGYKAKTDTNLLYKLCIDHKHSEEFFIQKAIGWALREYGKTNPQSVLEFVKSAELKPLSHREAIRNII